jgi:hypothetical protein
MDPKTQNELGSILRHPKVDRVFQEARELGYLASEPEIGDGFATLQRVKIRLGAAGRRATRDEDGELAKRLFDGSDFIRDRLRTIVPGYEAIDAEYARRIGLVEALHMGADTFRKTGAIDDFRNTFSRLSPAQRKEFRLGYASELKAQLENAQQNAGTARRLMERSPALDAELKTLFNDPADFEKFIDGLDVEVNTLRRAQKASGGAPNAYRMLTAEGGDPLELGANVGGSAMFGMSWAMAGLARLGLRAVGKSVSKRQAARLGPIMMTRGVPAIDALLTDIGRKPLVELGSSSTAKLPAALSGLLTSRR